MTDDLNDDLDYDDNNYDDDLDDDDFDYDDLDDDEEYIKDKFYFLIIDNKVKQVLNHKFIGLNETVISNYYINTLNEEKIFYNAIKLTSSLTKLYLESFKYNCNIHLLGNSLKFNKSIKELSLIHCNVYQIKSLADSLKVNSTLKVLNLVDNYITDMNELLDSLQYNKTLLKLNFCSNMYNLNNNSLSLQPIFLYKDLINKQHYNYDFYISKINNSLENMLSKNSTLQELNLSQNDLEYETLISISDGLKNNNTLKVLNLNDNNFDDISSLCEVLSFNTSLEKLSLNKSFNKDPVFNPKYTLKLISTLLDNRKSKCHLQYLELNGINYNFTFTNEDIQLFINSLKNNNYLKELILNNNDFINTKRSVKPPNFKYYYIRKIDYKMINGVCIENYIEKIENIHNIFNQLFDKIKIEFITD